MAKIDINGRQENQEEEEKGITITLSQRQMKMQNKSRNKHQFLPVECEPVLSETYPTEG